MSSLPTGLSRSAAGRSGSRGDAVRGAGRSRDSGWDYDTYLRGFATSVRNFGYPVVIGFRPDMNKPERSWARSHVPPATFIAAWRHIVNLFRRQGADNVSWLWTIRAGQPTPG